MVMERELVSALTERAKWLHMFRYRSSFDSPVSVPTQ